MYSSALFLLIICIISPTDTVIGHGDHHSSRPVRRPQKNKVLLILMDGMRYDTLDKGFKGINMMKESGVTTKKGLRPCFPSVSFTNYYCIATGLYSESHGMVGNDLYNLKTNQTFKLGCYPKNCLGVDQNPSWWDQAKPIWVTAQEQGKRVKTVHWPGSEVKLDGWTPKENNIDYTGYVKADLLEKDIQNVLEDFANDKLDFAAVYEEEPDHTQHLFGMWSQEAKRVIQTLDTTIEHMLERANMLTMSNDGVTPLGEVLDIIIVSDHGHMNLTDGRDIDLKDPVIKREDLIYSLPTGAVVHFWAKEGKKEKVYEDLKKVQYMKVWYREEIPEKWHFRNNERIGDMIAVANPGYYFSTDERPNSIHYPNGSQRLISTHGYDNFLPEMSGIFMARGPHFDKNYTVDSMDNVEVYQIICGILGITPNNHNGSWAKVSPFLVNVYQSENFLVSFKSVIITVILALILVGVITVFVCICHYQRQQNRTKAYKSLPTNLMNDLDSDELDL